jgi:pyruvate dehydrogenase phosphatase
MLPELLKTDDIVKTVETRHKFVALTEPASHGAVAASALVDAENKGLYVAVAGDCRAVAGWQRPDGSWRCDTLTEDQMGDNPKEVARMRSEHPVHEADTVIRNGRVQGGLQPTRAFGDAVYKWTTLQGEAIAAVFKDEGAKPRSIRPWNFTPPYVTARPEVTYRSLEGEDKLRFVVLATDGREYRRVETPADQLSTNYQCGTVSRPKRRLSSLPATSHTPRPSPSPRKALPQRSLSPSPSPVLTPSRRCPVQASVPRAPGRLTATRTLPLT